MLASVIMVPYVSFNKVCCSKYDLMASSYDYVIGTPGIFLVLLATSPLSDYRYSTPVLVAQLTIL